MSKRSRKNAPADPAPSDQAAAPPPPAKKTIRIRPRSSPARIEARIAQLEAQLAHRQEQESAREQKRKARRRALEEKRTRQRQTIVGRLLIRLVREGDAEAKRVLDKALALAPYDDRRRACLRDWDRRS